MLEPLTFPCRFSQEVGGCKSPRLFFVGTARGHLQKIGKSRDGAALTEWKMAAANATPTISVKTLWSAPTPLPSSN